MTMVLVLCTLLLSASSAAIARGAEAQPSATPLYSSLVASQWEFSLPESVLQQSLLFQGSTGRIKQVLMRLLAGKEVHVGCLGGSISIGKNAAPGKGYFELVAAWLSAAFPKANMVSRNGAIGGTPTMYVERFLDSRVDPEVDMVLLEYAVNNQLDMSTIHYEDMESYERLLRALLTGAHHAGPGMKPAAVLIVNMWRALNFDGAEYNFVPYTRYLGDHYNVLAQYYAVPSIAVRNGLYHAYRVGDGLFKDIKDAYPPDSHHNTVHPNDLGHKFMADMVIYAFYVALAQLQQYGGLTQGDMDIINSPQPPPLLAKRNEEIILRSWHEVAIQDLVVKASGWSWLEENNKGGMATTVPGSKLTIQLDTTVPTSMLLHHPRLRGSPVVVHLGLLRSYEHMGQVQVRCIAGCSCHSVVVDTNVPEDQSSQTYPHPIRVSESKTCKIMLECLASSTSAGKEHKLVLRGVSVTASLKARSGGMPIVSP